MHKLKLIIITIMSLIFIGCSSKSATVPITTQNIENPRMTHSKYSLKADLIIYTNSAFDMPVELNIDNKSIDYTAENTYGVYHLEPGIHWIKASSLENSSFICKDFKPNTRYIYKAYQKTNLFTSEKVKLVSGHNNDISSESRQFIQQNNIIDTSLDIKLKKDTNKTIMETISVSAKLPINSISITRFDNSDELKYFQYNIQNRLNKLNIPKGNDLILKLSIFEFNKGDRLGRILSFNAKSNSKSHASLLTKIEFYINNKKVDEFISYKFLLGGIFGGNTNSLFDLISNEVVSYITCKYYQR